MGAACLGHYSTCTRKFNPSSSHISIIIITIIITGVHVRLWGDAEPPEDVPAGCRGNGGHADGEDDIYHQSWRRTEPVCSECLFSPEKNFHQFCHRWRKFFIPWIFYPMIYSSLSQWCPDKEDRYQSFRYIILYLASSRHDIVKCYSIERWKFFTKQSHPSNVHSPLTEQSGWLLCHDEAVTWPDLRPGGLGGPTHIWSWRLCHRHDNQRVPVSTDWITRGNFSRSSSFAQISGTGWKLRSHLQTGRLWTVSGIQILLRCTMYNNILCSCGSVL